MSSINPGYGGLNKAPVSDRFAKARVAVKKEIESGGKLVPQQETTSPTSLQLRNKEVKQLKFSKAQTPSPEALLPFADKPIQYTTEDEINTLPESESKKIAALNAYQNLRKGDEAAKTAERRAELMQTAGKVMAFVAVGMLLFAFMGMTGGFKHAPLLNNALLDGAAVAGAGAGILGAALWVKGRNKENELYNKKQARVKEAGEIFKAKERQRVANFASEASPQASIALDDDTRSNSSSSSRASSPIDRPIIVLRHTDDIRDNAEALRKLHKDVSGTYDITTKYYDKDQKLILQSLKCIRDNRNLIIYSDSEGKEIGVEVLANSDDQGILGRKKK